MLLTAQPASEHAIAPFGTLVVPPSVAGERSFYTSWLGSNSATATPRLHVNFVEQTELPHRILKLEKHPHAPQIFLPLDVSRYLIVVAPSLSDGLPDLERLQAFVAPGTIGVIYKANVWHAGASALDRQSHFAVHMFRNDIDDDVFLDLPSPLEVALQNT